MVYNVRDVAIRGVFALYELKLPSSSVRGVLFECAIRSNCVADGSYNIWFVMSGSELRWENVLRDDVGSLWVCVFVVLKTFLFGVRDGGEVGGVRVVCVGYVVTEVSNWLFA
jgi:hypothetical protein